MSAMHHGAVLEGTWGSWGADSDDGVVNVADGAAAWRCYGPNCNPATWS